MKPSYLTLFAPLFFLVACNPSEHHYQGYVEAEDLYLSSPYSGTLVDLHVHRGQQVKKGDLLFQLDSKPESILIEQVAKQQEEAAYRLRDLKSPRRQNEILAKKAQVGQITSQLRLAELRLKRNSTLFDKNAASKDTLDAARERVNEFTHRKEEAIAALNLAKQGGRQSQIEAQHAKLGIATAKLEESKWELKQKTVYAPADGVIFDTYFQEGEFVGQQKPVLSLLPTNKKRVEFFVSSDMLQWLDVGQKITFSCQACQDKNTAIIHYISPKVEYAPPILYTRENSDKLVFRVKATIEEPAAFKPGQPVDIVVSHHAH